MQNAMNRLPVTVLSGFLGAGTTSAVTQALTGSGEIDPTSTLLSAGIGGIQGARIPSKFQTQVDPTMPGQGGTCLLYTSDAADE